MSKRARHRADAPTSPAPSSGTHRKAAVAPATVDRSAELAALRERADYVTQGIHEWASELDDDVGDLRAVVAHLESHLTHEMRGFEPILEAAKKALGSITHTTSYMRAAAWFGDEPDAADKGGE